MINETLLNKKINKSKCLRKYYSTQNELNYYILKDIHSSINIVLAIIFIILIIENYL